MKTKRSPITGRYLYAAWERIRVPSIFDAPAWEDIPAWKRARWNAIAAKVRAAVRRTKAEKPAKSCDRAGY